MPTQVSREVPIPSWLRALNGEIQAKFAGQGSPLQFYELVETQRPLVGSQPPGAPATVFSVEPELLSNTTQETFIQRSSCMGCHAMAGTLNPREFVSGDFTFTLNEALPRPARVGRVAPPSEPETEWDEAHWKDVQRGRQIAEHTYELLPDQVGSRLHCTSCHLDGGGNAQASWWVGMTEAYDYPATDRLQQRIDRCFTHSMNGKALTVAGQTSAEMQALIAYMQWLDSRAGTAHVNAGTRGFPDLPKLSGDARHGKELYAQKCTFCHTEDGAGRYLSNSYFRPAVWGEHSWPKRAGLGKDETLAAFLKANMPLGSGGMLTAQEAWDLAAFLNSQNRP
jgi:cytochrome c